MLRRLSRVASVVLAALVVGCASAGTRPAKPTAAVAKRPAAPAVTARSTPRVAPAPPVISDGPAPSGAPDPASVPDASPVPLPPPAAGANRPYQVFGRSYVPMTEDLPLVERGLASWYGRRFHGRRTASGEPYDMHAMTAAHPTLPLPSFALVRNLANGREVVVRINDRGPFHPGRIIDLSHVAATKLGVGGLSQVEVRRLTNDEIRTGAWRRAPGVDDPGAADDRRLALRRTESQLAASEASNDRDAAAPATLAALPASAPAGLAVAAAASVSVPASVPAADAVPMAVAVAATPPPARGTEPHRTAPDSDRAPSAETLVAALPPSAGPSGTEPPRGPAVSAIAALPGAAPASGIALPVGLTGYWVQLGAFRLRDGAESFRRRVVNEMTWIGPVLTVLSEAELHRLQAGPYASRDQASGVAQRLRDALSLVPVIVERR